MKGALLPWPLWAVVAGLTALLVAAVLTSLGLGSSAVGFDALWQTLRQGGDPVERTVILDIRLPRTLLALLVGSSLAMGGAVFQALLRNPLAEPYILGVSGGAAVGAIICATLGIAIQLVTVSLSFGFAMAATAIVFLIARRRLSLNTNVMILAGVVLNTLFSAVIVFFLSMSREPQSQTVFFWLMGNLSQVSFFEVAGYAPVVAAVLVVIGLFAHRLNVMTLGDETARQAGIVVERDKWLLFILTSLVTALAVSLAGIIGFVGLIIPHITRRLFGSDHRRLLPTAALLGASFLVLSDTAARTVLAPVELPVGVVTAAFGVPFFLSLLWRESRVT